MPHSEPDHSEPDHEEDHFEQHHEEDHEEEEDDDDEAKEVMVDFDFTDIQDSDYFGVLNLVKQVFGEDSQKVDLRAITTLILESIGIVVKVDESDPYALMAIVNLNSQLRKYFSMDKIQRYLKNCSWLVNDRLINMPTQLVPNLTRLVLEQVKIESRYILYYCKMGRWVHSELEENTKKRKMENYQVFYFQPEDEIIEKYALEKQDVEFDTQSMSSDAKRTFQEQGIVPFRRILILDNNLDQILKDLEAKIT